MQDNPRNVVHPYSPADLHLPHYRPNDKSIAELLGGFFGIVGVILTAIWILTGRAKNARLSAGKRATVCWFVLCGIIHIVLEGYFVANHSTLAGDMSVLGQLWKEYSMGDSRYLSSDACTLCQETITSTFDGVLALLTAWAILNKSPFRHVFQLVVSTCQLYGDIMYYSTEVVEGFKDTKMWHPRYFWFYFVVLNMFWIVIPLILASQAAYNLYLAQATHDASSKTVQDGRSGRKTKKIN